MIDEKTLRDTLSENLIHYRKQSGRTQAELAAMLNYSDKSVSKWERGEGVPDVIVLSTLAEFYKISVSDLLTPRGAEPAASEFPEEPAAPARRTRRVRSLKTRILVPVLSVGIVWLFSTFLYFLLKVIFPSLHAALPVFTWCIPATFIVLTVFSAIWWNAPLRFVCISGIVWSVALCFYLTFRNQPYMSLIFAVAGVMEVLVILWFILFGKRRDAGEDSDSPAPPDAGTLGASGTSGVSDVSGNL